MNMTDYQAQALRTDRTPPATGMSADAALLIPLLGLAGEAGQLLAEYKKRAWFKKCHFQVTPEIDRALMVKGFLVLGVTLI